MYLSKDILSVAYQRLKELDSREGKARQEKVSALRHLLASCELMKKKNTSTLSLQVNDTEARVDFINAVGRVVSLNNDGNYTNDFCADFAKRRDFGVRSNFYTTRLKDSRSHNVKYPGRPKPLLHLDNEIISLTDKLKDNLQSAYAIDAIRAPLVLWLLRNVELNLTGITTSSLAIKSEAEILLNKIYPEIITDILIPEEREIQQILENCSVHLVETTTNLEFILDLQDNFSKTEPIIEKAHALKNDLNDDDEIFLIINKLLERGSKGILLSGPPGTSKTWYALKLALKLTDGDLNRLSRVQFHQSYSYEDFIEGLVATGSFGGDEPLFKSKFKIFLNLCTKAKEDIDNTYYFIIDEFTRGDPSRIFGELLTYIEADYRDIEFILPYSEESFSIPQNVVIIATMNPYDKSVIDLDAAMERRFEIIELRPNQKTLKQFLKNNLVPDVTIGKIVLFFNTLNTYAEHGFGHTYFKDIKTEEDLVILWNHKFKFILEKMFRYKEDALKDIKNTYLAIFSDEYKKDIR